MIAIVQRVLEAKVVVAGETVGAIGAGMLVLTSIERTDTREQINWMASKLASLRIFRNGEKHFDQDIAQIGGAMLLVSNFTVSAETRKGRRPSFDAAADLADAEKLFNDFIAAVQALSIPVQAGRFGANMQVTLTNDGPATFIVRTDRAASS